MKHDEPTMCSLEWLEHERRKAWREGYAAGWKDQECDFPPHTTENPYKEQHMDNVNHPKHYENGPFECIELTRLLSFDWGNVVKYCYRWQSKNGVEDLRKAFWYAKDATMRGMQFYCDLDCDGPHARPLLEHLAEINWAGLSDVWKALAFGPRQKVLTVLVRKIAELENEKDGE